MNGGKRINKNHTKYAEYIGKCQKLWDRYEPLIRAEEERRKAECPDWMSGLDVLETVEKRKLESSRNRELKALQQEYAFLFTEAETEDSGK